MEKKKSPLSIRIFYWVTHVIFWLFTVVFAVLIIVNISLYFGAFKENMQLHVKFPVNVDFLEKGSITINNTDLDIEIVEANGSIHFIDTPVFISKRFFAAALPVFIISFLMFWMLKNFITDVKRDKIFDINNIKRLKRIAYAMAGLWLYILIYVRIVYYYLAKDAKFEMVELSDNQENFAGLLFIALFIWVLAHIFTVGLQLKEDNNLTI
jgi:hypothetical protein